MSASRLVLTVVLAIAAFGIGGEAHADRRLALVVGIDSYEHVMPLQKAKNDARAVSETLANIGFEVTTVLDPSRRYFNREIAQFSLSILPGDVVVFFFAGHGIGIDGRNYLLPADIPAAEAGEEQFIVSESIAADRLSSIFQAQGARVAFLILDACRNNPFPPTGTRSLGATRGLSRMDPPEGAFILFSAGTGQTALDRLSDDDPDPNSVFTRALLPRLEQPGLTVHDLVREVRADVRGLAATVRHDQFPAYYDQLSGSFSFNPAAPEAVAPTAAISVQPAPSQDACDGARSDWAILQTTNSKAALRQFAEIHASCPIYVAAAEDRLSVIENAAAAPTTLAPRAAEPAATTPLSCENLWYARNLIFHRNGFCFQSARAKAAFDTSSCTTRSPSLSSAETQEVERIQALESAQGC
ncbi:MAG: caspase family protein [Pseudomonadota bacterium]